MILKPEPTVQEKMDVCLLHFDRLMALKGENVAVSEMRKHASWYLKGIRGNGIARNMINQTETAQELKDYLRDFAEWSLAKEMKLQNLSLFNR